jgi:hypothetical protein
VLNKLSGNILGKIAGAAGLELGNGVNRGVELEGTPSNIVWETANLKPNSEVKKQRKKVKQRKNSDATINDLSQSTPRSKNNKKDRSL